MCDFFFFFFKHRNTCYLGRSAWDAKERNLCHTSVPEGPLCTRAKLKRVVRALSILFFHWLFHLHHRGEGWLSIRVKVSGRNPRAAVLFLGKQQIDRVRSFTPCTSGFVLDSKKAKFFLLVAVNGVHLHHCSLCTAVD